MPDPNNQYLDALASDENQQDAAARVFRGVKPKEEAETEEELSHRLEVSLMAAFIQGHHTLPN